MTLFCPYCHNLLLLDDEKGLVDLACSCCSYRLPVAQPVCVTKTFEPQRVEDESRLMAELENCEVAMRNCAECSGVKHFVYAFKLNDFERKLVKYFHCAQCHAIQSEFALAR